MQVHPLNRELYTDEPLDTEEPQPLAGLIESVQEHGVLVPLLVTQEHLVISGHRRLQAARKAGLTRIPSIVLPAYDENDLKRLLLESNFQRVKSTEERLREFREYLRLERMSAKTRQGARTDLNTYLVENFPQGAGGKARDLAAAKVGISGKSAERGLKVLEASDDRRDSDDIQPIEEVRNLLNERGIDGAYKRAVTLGWFNTAASGAPPASAKADVAVATPPASIPAPALAVEEGSAHPTSPENNAGTPVSVHPNVLSCPAEAGAPDEVGEASEPVVAPTARLLTPEAPAVEQDSPPNSELWVAPSRLEFYLTERRLQNATAPMQLVLSKDAQAKVEPFTRDLAKLINETVTGGESSLESFSLVSALRKSLVWLGTELSTQEHLRK
ncbi:ParB N-terminal domain-containing protein [Verrucomicrobiota bacterium sgz303538]